jgi:hypothetical protein
VRNDDQEVRLRFSYKRLGIFIAGIILVILLVGDNPLSSAVDNLISSIGSMLGIAKGATSWFSGRSERVYRIAALAMVLITIVAIVKIRKQK